MADLVSKAFETCFQMGTTFEFSFPSSCIKDTTNFERKGSLNLWQKVTLYILCGNGLLVAPAWRRPAMLIEILVDKLDMPFYVVHASWNHLVLFTLSVMSGTCIFCSRNLATEKPSNFVCIAWSFATVNGFL